MWSSLLLTCAWSSYAARVLTTFFIGISVPALPRRITEATRRKPSMSSAGEESEITYETVRTATGTYLRRKRKITRPKHPAKQAPSNCPYCKIDLTKYKKPWYHINQSCSKRVSANIDQTAGENAAVAVAGDASSDSDDQGLDGEQEINKVSTSNHSSVVVAILRPSDHHPNSHST